MLRFLSFLVVSATAATASGAPLIELTTSGQTVQGRQLAHDKTTCVLTDLDGRLLKIPLATVTGFRQVAPEFKSRTPMEVKKLLAAELGTSFEIAIRGRYIVAGPRGKAEGFAVLFDQTSREFLQYLRVRRFEVADPDVPLIAVVYPSRAQFDVQCAKDDVPAGAGLRGYYDQHSNRVTLYDDPREATVAASGAGVPEAAASGGSTRRTAAGRNRSIEANSGPMDSSDPARQTAIHEAIHQLAFNTGLHSRIGGNPLWVVEGLAMQFERGQGGYLKTKTSERVNLSRLKSFDAYRRQDRPAGGLATMIAGDEFFRKKPLEAYGEAWLFTNYLIETRSQKYGWYLKTLSTRDPLTPYPPEERLQDFKANFGEDLAWLEVEFLRYAEKVAVEAMAKEDDRQNR